VGFHSGGNPRYIKFLGFETVLKDAVRGEGHGRRKGGRQLPPQGPRGRGEPRNGSEPPPPIPATAWSGKARARGLKAEGGGAGAAERRVAVRKRDRSWKDEAAGKKLLEFFEAWGFKDPATIRGRRLLSSLLFS